MLIKNLYFLNKNKEARKMKKIFSIFLIIALILVVSIKAFSAEVKLGEGQIILDYVDSQTDADSARTPFNLLLMQLLMTM